MPRLTAEEIEYLGAHPEEANPAVWIPRLLRELRRHDKESAISLGAFINIRAALSASIHSKDPIEHRLRKAGTIVDEAIIKILGDKPDHARQAPP